MNSYKVNYLLIPIKLFWNISLALFLKGFLVYSVIFGTLFALVIVMNVMGENWPSAVSGFLSFPIWSEYFSDGHLNIDDIMSIFGILVLIFASIIELLKFFIKITLGHSLTMPKSIELVPLMLITILYLGALLSSFNSQVADNPWGMAFVLTLFWVLAVISYILFLLLNKIRTIFASSIVLDNNKSVTEAKI